MIINITYLNYDGLKRYYKKVVSNTSSLEKANIPSTELFTTPSNCVEVLMSIKYGSKDKLNMHTV